MVTFSHSGDFGDILYSMYFCNDFVKWNDPNGNGKFNLILTIDEKKWAAHKFQSEASPVTKMTIELLEKQPYIEKVVDFRDVPGFDLVKDSLVNVDEFRKLPINTSAGDIRNYYYHPWKSIHGAREFWKPVLFVDEDRSFADKIFLTYTFRCVNPNIDYSALKPYADKLVFIGFDSEKEFFTKKYFDLEHYKFSSFYDIASKMKGAIGTIGHPSGLYTIAECVKARRIFLSPDRQINNFIHKIEPGYVNVNPLGGWCDVAITTEKLLYLVDKMIEEGKTKCKDSL